MVFCENCNKLTRNRRFCSRSCTASATKGYTFKQSEETKAILSQKNKGRVLSEETRQKMSESQKRIVTDEKREFMRNLNYKDGRYTYRQRALEHYGEVCWNCQSTDKLHVHHVDGKRDDHSLENLLVLCEHCHLHVAHFWIAIGEWGLNEDFRLKVIASRTV